ncbi:hypothetical protein BGZ50_009480 [Haplosporangium sp. Z 11]|nr:hypothetical protein BGZ50_009480 [Haplosporangium sp. Z 11]
MEYNPTMSQGAQYLGRQQQLYVAHDNTQIQATFQMQQHLQHQILQQPQQQPQQQTVTPPPISDSGPFQQLSPVLRPSPALIASMQTISFEPPVKPAAVPFPVTSAASSPLFPFSCDDMDITSASFMATNTTLQPFAIDDNNIITSNNIVMATSGGTSMNTDVNAGPSFPAVQNVAQAMLEYENHSHINFSSGIPAPASMTNNYAPMSQPFSTPVSRASSALQFDETMVARLNLHQDTAIVSQTAGLAIETSLPLYDILPLASGTNAIQKDARAPASMSAPTMPETKRLTALRRSQSEKVASIDALPLVTSFGQVTSSSSSISRTPVMNRNRNTSQPIISPWSTVGAASTASSSSSSSSFHSVVSPAKSLSKSLRPLSTQFTFVTSTPQTNKEMFLGKIKTSGRRSSTPASQFQFQSPFQPVSTISKSLLMDTSKTMMPTPRRVTNPSSSLDKVISAALPVSSSSSSRLSQPLFITFDMNKVDKSSRGRCSGSAISKEIARLWNQEPECVKRLYEIEAEMERFRLKQTFPEYRYQRKSSNNKNDRKKKKH